MGGGGGGGEERDLRQVKLLQEHAKSTAGFISLVEKACFLCFLCVLYYHENIKTTSGYSNACLIDPEFDWQQVVTLLLKFSEKFCPGVGSSILNY